MNNKTSVDFLYILPSSISTDSSDVASLNWHSLESPFGCKSPLTLNAALPSVHGIAAALSPDECKAVIAMGEALPRYEGRAELGSDAYRVSHISWIEPHPENHWLFHRLGVLFAQANKHFDFELTGFVEALQFTRYGTDQYFDWHVDIGSDQTSARKLSLSIQLSGPDEYDGGILEFANLSTGEQTRQLGTAIFFPSYLLHHVSPVTRGVRRSLVVWGYGPAFR
ncbi:MAG: hypothetical protein JWN23_2026 [Rhodocyclales bacterium]|nr:hypothetical protein [Rhodocyclales bacterium]